MKFTVSPARIAAAATAAFVMFSPLAALAAGPTVNGGVPIQPAPGTTPAGLPSSGAPDGIRQCASDQVWCLVGDAQTPLGWVQGAYAPSPSTVPTPAPNTARGAYNPWL
ncbi:MAG: hypothetical protein JWQ89_4091 [Devosia sp.]|uniref:hypothetical protein n=1 Tax=Devosia sp. TaxID=1871048 RepID=UPI00260F2766|nr:hypothetical protein [Devosia sp.]MDB5542364.1 hypothetical protein [Devosia sp.]